MCATNAKIQACMQIIALIYLKIKSVITLFFELKDLKKITM